ncbi:MAG: biopolymer transporter ExbD [Planctomycetaceae bacterium]|nr:biopolymer transporter ExbD [Planctomycetaceae bacterium]
MRRPDGAAFNITPLIDIVFLLVIFFLVASHFARSEPTETVNLPEAAQTTEDEFPRRLTVTVLPDGTYSVNAQVVSLAEIEVMIADGAGNAPDEYAVRLRGDREVNYESIEPIMLACARNGITKFGFHVIKE